MITRCRLGLISPIRAAFPRQATELIRPGSLGCWLLSMTLDKADQTTVKISHNGLGSPYGRR